MIFDKARMAKLSGIMTESAKGIKNPMADQFGGGKDEGDPWLDGEVTTEGDMGTEGEMMDELDDKVEGDDHPVEARRKKGHDDKEEEAVREMIRKELKMAKEDMKQEKREEEAVREAVRKEIRSVIRSRGTTLGGVGWGFKR
jgi:hypothetical protein